VGVTDPTAETDPLAVKTGIARRTWSALITAQTGGVVDQAPFLCEHKAALAALELVIDDPRTSEAIVSRADAWRWANGG
jgi:hypothetical protein